MTQPDLQERLHNLGYTKPDTTLKAHLHYYQLAPWPALDTPAGGQRLIQEALATRSLLVVIDTLIRTVDGEENSSDTIKNFNRYTGQPLKAAGISLLRVDHAGKDATRGQRGTSAKRDDVDVVWLLKPGEAQLPGSTSLTLKREAARVDWIQKDIHITRTQGPPLTHTIPHTVELTTADMRIVDYLQNVGIWGSNVSNPVAREALDNSDLAASSSRLGHVVKWMKRYGDKGPKPTQTTDSGGKASGMTQSGQAERQAERQPETRKAQVTAAERQRKGSGKKTQGKRKVASHTSVTHSAPHNPDEEEELPIPW